MAFKFNPTTGTWAVVPAGQNDGGQSKTFPPLTAAQKNDSKLRQISSQFGMSPQQLLYGNTPQNKAAKASYTKATATSATPYGVGQGTYGNVSLPEPPQKGDRVWVGREAPTPAAPTGADTVNDPQGVINSLWQNVYDEAAEYQTIYGDAPPSGWWSARTAPIEAAQKRLDLSTKGQGGGGAAAKAAAAEAERVRGIKGGQAGEAFLREQAVTRKADMLKRVAELYDPQQTKSAEDLKTVLKQASDAYDLAEKQVGEAQANFQQQFRPSTAYEGIPIATYNVADNPLIAALQQQGAGTGQVDAATNYARQFAEQTSGLEKWAAGQLGTGQKNFEAAAQNAAQMGTMAALQGLGQRRADVKTSIEQQFADALAKINADRTTAESGVDTTIADIIAEADKLRAETLTKYGTLPAKKKVPAPVVKPKVPTQTPPKAPVTPPVVAPKNIKQNVR